MTSRPVASDPHATQPVVTAAELLGAALGYAAAGIAVLPLHTPDQAQVCSCRAGRRCPSAGKHPRLPHGLHEASRDAEVIAGWWRRWPHANIGLATGDVLEVCDIDTSSGLRAVLDLLDVIRPPGPLVRTGSGWHLWYAASKLPSRVSVLPGVDWRGRGGLVVAPPSLHANGRRYSFQQPFTDVVALPACPAPLRTLVLPPPTPRSPPRPITDLDRYTQAALAGEIERIRTAPRPLTRDGRRVRGGGRNDALNTAAFRLGQLAARIRMDEHAVRRHLTDAALSAGLSRAEVNRTISSGWRAGLRHPRQFGRPVNPSGNSAPAHQLRREPRVGVTPPPRSRAGERPQRTGSSPFSGSAGDDT